MGPNTISKMTDSITTDIPASIVNSLSNACLVLSCIYALPSAFLARDKNTSLTRFKLNVMINSHTPTANNAP